MIINQEALLAYSPIVDMLTTKEKLNGFSHGLTEAGYDIRIAQDVMMSYSNRFQLASAVEEFDMPSDMVGRVCDKSTWARQGLSVFNTVIEPGWKGFLTLELVYHGNGKLFIPKGTGIAQVLFQLVYEDVNYDGKYQGQGKEPTPAKFD